MASSSYSSNCSSSSSTSSIFTYGDRDNTETSEPKRQRTSRSIPEGNSDQADLTSSTIYSKPLLSTEYSKPLLSTECSNPLLSTGYSNPLLSAGFWTLDRDFWEYRYEVAHEIAKSGFSVIVLYSQVKFFPTTALNPDMAISLILHILFEEYKQDWRRSVKIHTGDNIHDDKKSGCYWVICQHKFVRCDGFKMVTLSTIDNLYGITFSVTIVHCYERSLPVYDHRVIHILAVNLYASYEFRAVAFNTCSNMMEQYNKEGKILITVGNFAPDPTDYADYKMRVSMGYQDRCLIEGDDEVEHNIIHNGKRLVNHISPKIPTYATVNPLQEMIKVGDISYYLATSPYFASLSSDTSDTSDSSDPDGVYVLHSTSRIFTHIDLQWILNPIVCNQSAMTLINTLQNARYAGFSLEEVKTGCNKYYKMMLAGLVKKTDRPSSHFLCGFHLTDPKQLSYDINALSNGIAHEIAPLTPLIPLAHEIPSLTPLSTTSLTTLPVLSQLITCGSYALSFTDISNSLVLSSGPRKPRRPTDLIAVTGLTTVTGLTAHTEKPNDPNAIRELFASIAHTRPHKTCIISFADTTHVPEMQRITYLMYFIDVSDLSMELPLPSRTHVINVTDEPDLDTQSLPSVSTMSQEHQMHQSHQLPSLPSLPLITPGKYAICFTDRSHLPTRLPEVSTLQQTTCVMSFIDVAHTSSTPVTYFIAFVNVSNFVMQLPVPPRPHIISVSDKLSLPL